jgi:hypothetical protein
VESDVCRCEEVENKGRILEEFGSSVWEGVRGGDRGTGEGNDPIANGRNRSLRDGRSELDFEFSQDLGASIIVGGGKSSSEYNIEVDNSSREYIRPFRFRKLRASVRVKKGSSESFKITGVEADKVIGL